MVSKIEKKNDLNPSLFTDSMILYIGNPKVLTYKTKQNKQIWLKLINEFSKADSTHKNSLCFYTLAMDNLKRNYGNNSIYNKSKTIECQVIEGDRTYKTLVN